MPYGTMVDAPPASDWLHIVLGHVFGDAHGPKDALAVICSARSHHSSGDGMYGVSSDHSEGKSQHYEIIDASRQNS